MNPRDLKFRTRDMRFGLSLDESVVRKILLLCRQSEGVETGGILVGHYSKNHDWATVTDLSGPPADSRQGRAFFHRGVKGLQKWINELWSMKQRYFLGEWHYHPFASPEASADDERQMKDHSENIQLMCPEPIMLIVGGNPNGLWLTKAYVFPKGTSLCLMTEINLADAPELLKHKE